MAVPKSRVTRSRRDKRRSHLSLSPPTSSVDKTTGEIHLRHRVTKNGYYLGKRVVILKKKKQKKEHVETSEQ